MRYSLPGCCVVTFITGVVEIVLVANGIIEINSHTALVTSQMFSARLGIATIALCPLIVAINVAAINRVMAQVSRRADYDYLTGVYSRSGLHEALKRLDEQSCRPRQIGVMLLDIDYFKNINDTYGHECGDKVLAAFASKVSLVVRDRGLVALMGGEEFVVECPRASQEQAFAIAEKSRHAVAGHPFEWQKQTLHLKVSIELGSRERAWNSAVEAFDNLMHLADRTFICPKTPGATEPVTTANRWRFYFKLALIAARPCINIFFYLIHLMFSFNRIC